MTDGGLETTLVFYEGIDLPAFAAFPLLDSADGRAALRGCFARFYAVGRVSGRRAVARNRMRSARFAS